MSVSELEGDDSSPGGDETERWVWSQVRAGGKADLHVRCGERLDPSDGADVRWHDSRRRISSTFIERVLTQKPWRDVLSHRGLHLVGAYVAEPIDLFAAHIASVVSFDESRFESAVRLEAVKFESTVTFNGSVFENGIDASMLDAERILHFSKITVRGKPLTLKVANVKGSVNMEASTFENGVDAAGIRIGGSLYLRGGTTMRGKPLILSTAKIEGSVEMQGSTFETGVEANSVRVGDNLLLHSNAVVRGGTLMLRAAEIKGSLEMQGSVFEGGVEAGNLRVGRHIILRDGATVRGGGLTLRMAEIGGVLDMSGSTFEAGIDITSTHVGGSLYLRNGTTVRGGALILRTAEINGILDMRGSTFEGNVLAEHLHANQSLLLGGRSKFLGQSLTLSAAVIKRDIEMSDSEFEVEMLAENLYVGGNVLLRDGDFRSSPSIRLSHIDGVLNLSGATLPGLDLSGTTIKGDLHLASGQTPPPTWRESARIVLRNVHAGALQDSQDAWPPNLDLHGFVYDRLGGIHRRGDIHNGGEDSMLVRPVAWYIDNFLARDPILARQPYQQLATVFRAAGYSDRAETVLYAVRDRERVESWKQGGYLNYIGLSLLKYTISYGLTNRFPKLVIAWVMGLTFLGALILSIPPSKALLEHGLFWRLFASFDQLLPIVELNREFGDFFVDQNRNKLAAWQIGYFSIHAFFGYVLGSFVVAALAGLTQARR